MISIDEYSHESGLRYTNAFTKCLFSGITLLLCLLCKSIPVSAAVIIAASFLSLYYGKIQFKKYIRLYCIPVVFLLFSGFSIVFQIASSPAVQAVYELFIFNRYIFITYASLWHVIQLSATALGCISCMYFLALSTPITDILMVLQRIKFPGTIIELMMFTYRFIFILLQTAHEINIAQAARLGNINYKTALKTKSILLSQLLAGALRKSDNIYNAMEARGYSGTLTYLKEWKPVEKKHIIYILSFEAMLLIIFYFTR